MRSSSKAVHYVLVPRPPQSDPRSGDDASPAAGGSTPPRVRRYSLARVGVSRRSALGEDRHARLEEVADRSDRGG